MTEQEEPQTDSHKMPVFIDLTTDFGFKRVFKRKEFMIPFLNDLLKALPGAKITDLR